MSEFSLRTLRDSQLTPNSTRPIHTGEQEETSPAVRIQKMIFEQAISIEASDVHIEPHASMTGIRYRVNGQMKEGLSVPRWMHENLVARIKILAKLDISERRLPQDGQISAEGTAPDIRVSVLPSKHGEKIVLRMLPNNRAPRSLAELNIPYNVEETLRALIHRPQGIILVVGPTGSGKTTSLYAMI